MPEYLLHVLVTACKAVRCCFYVYIVTIALDLLTSGGQQ